MLGLLTGKGTIRILIGAAVVVAVVGLTTTPPQDTPCTTVSNLPGRSSVYECKAGLSTVLFENKTKVATYSTITSSIQTEAWLTRAGDTETIKTLRGHLGAPVILGGGGFMAVSTPAEGSSLAYVVSKSTVVLTVVWDAQTTH
jgi:hypothetical protein